MVAFTEGRYGATWLAWLSQVSICCQKEVGYHRTLLSGLDDRDDGLLSEVMPSCQLVRVPMMDVIT